jgi:hypothetical protein
MKGTLATPFFRANPTTFEFTATYNASVVCRLERFYVREKYFLLFFPGLVSEHER